MKPAPSANPKDNDVTVQYAQKPVRNTRLIVFSVVLVVLSLSSAGYFIARTVEWTGVLPSSYLLQPSRAKTDEVRLELIKRLQDGRLSTSDRDKLFDVFLDAPQLQCASRLPPHAGITLSAAYTTRLRCARYTFDVIDWEVRSGDKTLVSSSDKKSRHTYDGFDNKAGFRKDGIHIECPGLEAGEQELFFTGKMAAYDEQGNNKTAVYEKSFNVSTKISIEGKVSDYTHAHSGQTFDLMMRRTAMIAVLRDREKPRRLVIPILTQHRNVRIAGTLWVRDPDSGEPFAALGSFWEAGFLPQFVYFDSPRKKTTRLDIAVVPDGKVAAQYAIEDYYNAVIEWDNVPVKAVKMGRNPPIYPEYFQPPSRVGEKKSDFNSQNSL